LDIAIAHNCEPVAAVLRKHGGRSAQSASVGEGDGLKCLAGHRLVRMETMTGYVCDSCEGTPAGPRWSCRRCEFDLCQPCTAPAPAPAPAPSKSGPT
jgi:hypothetical protein